jgi:pimeloyl-ACP methyl ester carboxylesterase
MPTVELGGVGWMAKRPLPEELVDRWLRPLQTQRAIRRDLRKYAIGVRRRQLLEVPDSYTLIMRDQPQAFARAVREFVRAAPAVAG